MSLNVAGLDVSYGVVRAVEKVSLLIAPGEVVSLIGSNGAGKSSILKALMDLTPHACLSMSVDGRDVRRAGSRARIDAGIALSPEGRHVFAQLSVRENMDLGYLGTDKTEQARRRQELYVRFPKLLDREWQLAGSLSGGEQQMLAIARAVMAGPKVLLLDEPTLGLAPIVVRELVAAIRHFSQSGMSVLLAEQNAEMALSVADRGYVLQGGHIVMEGTASDLHSNGNVRAAFMGM